MATKLPASLSKSLAALAEELAAAAGANLAGLVLYGGLARGRYRQGQSDVNLLVLLEDASGPALAAVAPALRRARREIAADPMLLARAELEQAAALFPTKFLDVLAHHVVLAGEAPLAGLEVAREHLLLRLRQELRNLLMRLRHRFVLAGDDPPALGRLLAEVARPLALELAALLLVAGHQLPEDDRSAAIFAAAARELSLDGPTLARLSELRQGKGGGADVATVFEGVLGVVERAVARAEALGEVTP